MSYGFESRCLLSGTSSRPAQWPHPASSPTDSVDISPVDKTAEAWNWPFFLHTVSSLRLRATVSLLTLKCSWRDAKVKVQDNFIRADSLVRRLLVWNVHWSYRKRGKMSIHIYSCCTTQKKYCLEHRRTIWKLFFRLNLLTPNDPYSGRTAPLTSNFAFYIFIQQI